MHQYFSVRVFCVMLLTFYFINSALSQACNDPNEERRSCAPNKRCSTCGVQICTQECQVNACICKQGFRYNAGGICIPEHQC